MFFTNEQKFLITFAYLHLSNYMFSIYMSNYILMKIHVYLIHFVAAFASLPKLRADVLHCTRVHICQLLAM